MYIPHIVRKIVNILRRPSIQRLITLVVATLLAMSLGYATIVLAPPMGGKDVTSLPAIVASLETANGQALNIPERAFVPIQVMVQRTVRHLTERRSA
jgi:hypothetical protein